MRFGDDPIVNKVVNSVNLMTECYSSLEQASLELHEILQQYSINTEFGEDERFRRYLLEYQRRNLKLKAKMNEAESTPSPLILRLSV